MLAGNELGERGERVEVDLLRHAPAAVIIELAHDDAFGGKLKRRAVMAVQEDEIAAREHVGAELGPLDRAHMHAGLDPAREEDGIDGVARAHHDVHALYRFFGRSDGHDLHIELRAHLGRESLAVRFARAEAADGLDGTDVRHRHRLSASLPSGTKHPHRSRILAGEIFDREPVRGAHPHALHHAVGHDRQRLARLARE